LVVGYDPGRHQLIGYLYSDKPEPEPQRRALDSLDYLVDLGPKPQSPPDPLDALIAALKSPFGPANTAAEPGILHGSAAYAAWAKCLRDGVGIEPGKPLSREYVQANEWAMDVLIDARKAAVQYLHRSAQELPSLPARLLIGAADQYDQVLKQLDTADFYLYSPREGKMPIREALATPEGRERFAAVLTGAESIESRAIDELKNALRVQGGR
jgi:hypothetical protein